MSEFPKTVILSHHPMSTDSAAGLAIRSFFKNWDQEKLIHLFTPTVRWGKPDFDFCKDYRRVNWLGRVAPVVNNVTVDRASSAIGGSMLKRLAGLRSVQKTLLPLREAWMTRKKYAQGIQEELERIAPEVVYVMASSLYLTKAACIACENLDIPVCMHVVDDIDSETCVANEKRTNRGKETKKWMERLIAHATTHLGISPQMADEYNRRYGQDWDWFTTLTDSDDYAPKPRIVEPGSPIKFVFAGNLSYDRWREIRSLGVALRKIKEDGVSTKLTVYGSPAHFKLYASKLQIAGVELREWVPVDELAKVFQDADILVHVESFHDLEMRQAIRLSLSTKLSQYMMAGRPIFGIGPSELASIQFIEDSKAGIVFDMEKSGCLVERIRGMIHDRSLLEQLGANGREKAKLVFEGDTQRKKFLQLMRETIAKHRQIEIDRK